MYINMYFKMERAVNAWFMVFQGQRLWSAGGAWGLHGPAQVGPISLQLTHRNYEIKWIAENAQNRTADTYCLGSAIIGCDILATCDCHEFELDWWRLLQIFNKIHGSASGPNAPFSGLDGGLMEFQWAFKRSSLG